MSHWETAGKSDDWYTPRSIFTALDTWFDMDVAGKLCPAYCVPSSVVIQEKSLEVNWEGFVWMNPPFGGRNQIMPWMDKFFQHGNGIALTPDRTSAPWFQHSWNKAQFVMFTPKIKFLREDGTEGKSPSNGTALWGYGPRACSALRNAERLNLGILAMPSSQGWDL